MYKTKYYELAFDAAENQIYWKIIGFWPSMDAVPQVKQRWNEILSQTKPGFSVLADMTEMKAAPEEVEAFHISLQKKILDAGVGKIASLVSQSAIAALAGRRVGTETGVANVAQNFTDRAAAQSWLDES